MNYLSHDEISRSQFVRRFDREPFLFTHSLDQQPLFAMPALIKLAMMAAGDRDNGGFLRFSNKSRGLRWGDSDFVDELAQTLRKLDHSNIRLKLSHIHVYPGYDEILSSCTEELAFISGVEIKNKYRAGIETVFISSPGEFTPFHLDSEANFLYQIQGSKTVFILDGNDRDLIAWHELEDYWQGSGVVPQRDEFIARAHRFELHPGLGVHNPVNFPHWVQNGSSTSVSLSIGFPRVEDPIDVLRLNHVLRKIGLSPVPPGVSGRRDAAKRTFMRQARALKQSLGVKKALVRH
jgi:hypothetical protein